jgi:hypothetical protein
VAEIDLDALKLELERSRTARLRAWAVLKELSAILRAVGQELPESPGKSFPREGEILERGLKRVPAERDEVPRELERLLAG